jgi:hypothetical protein
MQPAGDAVSSWNIVDEAGRPRKTATVFDMGYAHALHAAGERDVCKPPLLIEVPVSARKRRRIPSGQGYMRKFEAFAFVNRHQPHTPVGRLAWCRACEGSTVEQIRRAVKPAGEGNEFLQVLQPIFCFFGATGADIARCSVRSSRRDSWSARELILSLPTERTASAK